MCKVADERNRQCDEMSFPLSPTDSNNRPRVDLITIATNADSKATSVDKINDSNNQDLMPKNSATSALLLPKRGHAHKKSVSFAQCDEMLHDHVVSPPGKENGIQSHIAHDSIISEKGIDIEAQISSKRPSRGNVLSRWNFQNTTNAETLKPTANEGSISSTATSSKVQGTAEVLPRSGLVADIARKWSMPNIEDSKPKNVPLPKSTCGLDTSPSKQEMQNKYLPRESSMHSSNTKQLAFSPSTTFQNEPPPSEGKKPQNVESNAGSRNSFNDAKQSSASSWGGSPISNATDPSFQTSSDEENVRINTLSDGGIMLSMSFNDEKMYNYPHVAGDIMVTGDQNKVHHSISSANATQQESLQPSTKPLLQGKKPPLQSNKSLEQGNKSSFQGNKPSEQGKEPSLQGNKPSGQSNNPPLQSIKLLERSKTPPEQSFKSSLQDRNATLQSSKQPAIAKKPILEKQNPFAENLEVLLNIPCKSQDQYTTDDSNDGITMDFSMPADEDENLHDSSDANTFTPPFDPETMNDSNEDNTKSTLVTLFPEDNVDAIIEDENEMENLFDDDSEDEIDTHHFSPRAGFIGSLSHKWLFPTSFSGNDPFKAFTEASNAMHNI